MRVLLIAEACNPAWTSVPLVGFNMARAIASHPAVEATIATSIRNRPDIEASELPQLAAIHYVDSERVSGPMFRLGKRLRGGATLGWTTAMAFNWPSYVSFERTLERSLRDDLKAGRFDLVHRLTPLSPALPSPIASRLPVPFSLGPINGGLPWPKEYPELRRREREWLSPLRSVVRYLPYYRSTYRHAAGVLTASRSAMSGLPHDFAGLHCHLPENGIDPDRFDRGCLNRAGDAPRPDDRFTFVSVGRLVPLKAFDIVVEALARIGGDSRLVVIGDGPERKTLLSLAARCDVTERVEFRGWLSQPEVAEQLRQSQAFVLPSLREFGGGAVLEAMASGLPSIVTDYGGPAELVGDDCGLCVPMAPRAELIASVAAAMRTLRDDPAAAALMGRTAAETVAREHTWTAKADRVVGFWDAILQHVGSVPAMRPALTERLPA